MWLDYEKFDFPTPPVEVELMNGLHELTIFVKHADLKVSED